MAGSTRTAADPHDAAYKLGIAGKPLSASLKRHAETDDSILDSWREGKADRPGDQPDSEEQSAPDPATRQGHYAEDPEGTYKGLPKAKPRRAPERDAPQPRPRTGPSRTRRRQAPASRSRTGRPTLQDPTGGRLPIGFDGDGIAGAFFGAVLYALVISVADYGTKGPLLWFKAKFLNQPAGAPAGSSSSATASPSTPPTATLA